MHSSRRGSYANTTARARSVEDTFFNLCYNETYEYIDYGENDGREENKHRTGSQKTRTV